MSARTSTVVRLLGSPPIERLSLQLTARRLRVVAYHGVPDPRTFRAHLEHLTRHYCLVSGDQVRTAITDGSPLPRRALWITFDDGQRNVIENGLPELQRLDVPATLFVCPGLVSEGQPFWWSQVQRTLDEHPLEFEGLTWTDRKLVVRLKQVNDDVRRRFLAGLPTTDPDQLDMSVTIDGIAQWVQSGREVGNHTWDHPCLTRCSVDEQERQILAAHDWLADFLGNPPDLFAYPNGDASAVARSVLADKGYAVGVRFDHQLVKRSDDPLLMSRLRLDSDAGIDRTRAIASGAHSSVFSIRSALASRLQR